MLHFRSPVGSPAFVNRLGKSFPKAQRGITFPPAPVSTLHRRLARFFDAIDISTFAKASVIASMEMSAKVISSGSLGLFWLVSQAFRDFVVMRVSFRNTYFVNFLLASRTMARWLLGVGCFLGSWSCHLGFPALDSPVPDPLTGMARRVLCWAVLPAWSMGLSAIATL